jgi:Flp pilus assembly protein TadB
MPVNWYSTACKFTTQNFNWLVGDIEKFKKKSEDSLSQEFLDSLNFCGFEIEPYEPQILAISGALISFILLLIVDVFLFSFSVFGSMTIAVIIIITVLIPVTVLFYLSEYPKIQAKFIKIRSLGDIPEILSYIVMSMKLVSNMELAISFAAENSSRPLASDMRKLIWDMHVRVYSSMDDALIAFANQWGRNSEYFKRALHLVKSSTNEPDEAQRVITLNKSLDIVLEGTRKMMEGFAVRLKTPTYILYSIFILIPLALVALLPALTIVGVHIEPVILILIYDLILPIITFAYAQYILLQRPATFPPPRIPDEHPRLANIRYRKNLVMVVSLIVAVCISTSGFMWLSIGNPGGIISTGAMDGYISVFFPFIWGITAFITIYALGVYTPYKNIRDEIKEIESQFADALFVLGRRITEGRSPEWAFMQTAQTMKGSLIGETFEDVARNLSILRTTLIGAIFDKEYGAFRNIYSERVHTTMHLFTKSVYKSHTAAGIAIVKLADHLKELQEVEENIKRSLYDVTSTMRSTAVLFAPLIGGITLALSEVIQKILENIAHEASKLPDDIGMGAIMEDVGSGMEQSISPDVFMFSIGFYMIILVVILVRFAGGIEYGEDKAQFMYDLGSVLPVSILVFSLSVVVSRILFAGIV